jgi:solute carrier family 30 (zinc transporter), member 5/7
MNGSVPPTPFSANSPFPPSPGAAPIHHHHHHENENMRGIFLHILADALGSLSVIISTLLTQYTGWHGWDPIASCLISVLIFASAVPLVKTAAMRLLLSLPDDVEYSVRGALGELQGLRGVVGVSVVRLWQGESGHSQAPSHLHGHDHDDHHAHAGRGDCHEHEQQVEASVLGVMHIIASRSADVDDVRERVALFLKGRGMDVVAHVEREGDGRCWCGGGGGPKSG